MSNSAFWWSWPPSGDVLNTMLCQILPLPLVVLTLIWWMDHSKNLLLCSNYSLLELHIHWIWTLINAYATSLEGGSHHLIKKSLIWIVCILVVCYIYSKRSWTLFKIFNWWMIVKFVAIYVKYCSLQGLAPVYPHSQGTTFVVIIHWFDNGDRYV